MSHELELEGADSATRMVPLAVLFRTALSWARTTF